MTTTISRIATFFRVSCTRCTWPNVSALLPEKEAHSVVLSQSAPCHSLTSSHTFRTRNIAVDVLLQRTRLRLWCGGQGLRADSSYTRSTSRVSSSGFCESTRRSSLLFCLVSIQWWYLLPICARLSCVWCFLHCLHKCAALVPVGEEDEVSIKEAAEMVIEAMDFKGKVVVSFLLVNIVGKLRSHVLSQFFPETLRIAVDQLCSNDANDTR